MGPDGRSSGPIDDTAAAPTPVKAVRPNGLGRGNRLFATRDGGPRTTIFPRSDSASLGPEVVMILEASRPPSEVCAKPVLVDQGETIRASLRRDSGG